VGQETTTRLFTGKERDGGAYAGLDYFGARYYQPGFTMWSEGQRWISADSVTGHIYDPPSLNKYAYVRNDPVNLVDRNGRWYECAERSREGDCVFWYFDPTPHEPRLDPPSRPPTKAELIASGDWYPPEPQLDSLLANKDLLESGLKARAGIEEKKGKCYDFLAKVIAQLSGVSGRGSGPVLAANFTVDTLVNNVMAAAKTATTVAQLGANARTVGNAIIIARDPVEPMGNDNLSTLLHEGFHLLMSSRGRSQISDERLKDATSFADGTVYRWGSTSEFNKQMFGQNCGPGI